MPVAAACWLTCTLCVRCVQTSAHTLWSLLITICALVGISSWAGTLLGTYYLANCVITQVCQLAAIPKPSLAGLLLVDMQLAPDAFVMTVYECLGANIQHVEALLLLFVPAWGFVCAASHLVMGLPNLQNHCFDDVGQAGFLCWI